MRTAGAAVARHRRVRTVVYTTASVLVIAGGLFGGLLGLPASATPVNAQAATASSGQMAGGS